jgi:hypothetical protein
MSSYIGLGWPWDGVLGVSVADTCRYAYMYDLLDLLLLCYMSNKLFLTSINTRASRNRHPPRAQTISKASLPVITLL